MLTFTVAPEPREPETSTATSMIVTFLPLAFILLMFVLFMGVLRKARNTQMQWYEQSMRHMARLEEIHARGVATLEAIQQDLQRGRRD